MDRKEREGRLIKMFIPLLNNFINTKLIFIYSSIFFLWCHLYELFLYENFFYMFSLTSSSFLLTLFLTSLQFLIPAFIYSLEYTLRTLKTSFSVRGKTFYYDTFDAYSTIFVLMSSISSLILSIMFVSFCLSVLGFLVKCSLYFFYSIWCWTCYWLQWQRSTIFLRMSSSFSSEPPWVLHFTQKV